MRWRVIVASASSSSCVVPGHDERRHGDLEAVALVAARGAASLEGGHDHLAQVALGEEGVGEEALGHLAGDLGHPSRRRRRGRSSGTP